MNQNPTNLFVGVCQEKQRQIGKVRIVKWVSQDEKQFLDELVFPNLPKLVEKWKAQQKEMPENL